MDTIKECKGEKAQQELPESHQKSLSMTNGTNNDNPSTGDELTNSTEQTVTNYVKPAYETQGYVLLDFILKKPTKQRKP